MRIRTRRNRNELKQWAVFLLCIFCAPFCAAAADWILAASPFEVNSYSTVKASEREAANLLPSLILDQFSSGFIRTIPLSETQARELATLKKAQQALFLQLTAAVKKRDAVVLENRNPRTVTKKIAVEEKKIAEIKEKLDQNMQEINAFLPEFATETLAEETRPSLFTRIFRKKTTKEDASASPEPVAIWKNDMQALLAGTELETAKKEGKINGLITGKIMAQDEYAAVSVELRAFPGGELLGSAMDIGRLADSNSIVRSLYFSLLPPIVNSLPVILQFEVYPPEIRDTIHITIGDIVLSEIPDSYSVQSGVRQIGFDAEGYEIESLSMNFEGGTTYLISVELHEKRLNAISLSLKKDALGLFLINAKTLGDTPVSVETSGRTMLGRFDPEAGLPGYFVVPANAASSGKTDWTVKPNTADISARIETSRKIMYASYSAFILSLPVVFYFWGEYTKYNVAAYVTPTAGNIDTWREWEKNKNIATGVTIGLAANFFVQLFVYLYRANAIIPATATVEKK
jgi:hypothetical protein